MALQKVFYIWILCDSGVLLTSGKFHTDPWQAAFTFFWYLIPVRKSFGDLHLACIPGSSSGGNLGMDEGLGRAGSHGDLRCNRYYFLMFKMRPGGSPAVRNCSSRFLCFQRSFRLMDVGVEWEHTWLKPQLLA